MRTFKAILLLAIILFNIGGQLAFHQYFSYKSDRFYSRQIAQNKYNLKDLTEISIPVNLPGINDQENFEDVAGQIRFENCSYNYVKIRLTKTAMYLMCVPNYDTTLLSSQNIIEAKGVKDIPKKEHVPFGKINIIVCHHEQMQYRLSIPVKSTFKKYTYNSHPNICNAPITGPGQPPDMAANILS